MDKLIVAVAALGLLSFAGAAAADTTYVASRAVNVGHVDLSITTDGDVGILTTADIVDWTVVVSDGADSFSLQGPAGANNSAFLLVGSGLTATASELFYNFDSVGGAFLIQTPNTGSRLQAWCVTFGSCGLGAGEIIIPDAHQTTAFQSYSGNQIIASATAGVPEPASWALTIGGFGVAGTALRRRRNAAAVAA
jgi:hypothetical protein